MESLSAAAAPVFLPAVDFELLAIPLSLSRKNNKGDCWSVNESPVEGLEKV